MSFSVPDQALIVVADGAHAVLYRNTAQSGVTLEHAGDIAHGHGGQHGAPKASHDLSPREEEEAKFARHIAEELHTRITRDHVKAVVLVADPQTLGQIRPALHADVQRHIVGELHKTLIKSSIADIEKILAAETLKAKAA